MGGRKQPLPADRRRSVRGQSIAELALLLPLLTMILLGGVDLGRAYYFYSGVANATRVGAQYAIDPRTDPNEVKNAIIVEASPYVALTPDKITFTAPYGWVSGEDLTVQVQYDFHFLTPFAGNLWGDPIVMTYDATVRFE